jgi:hypothetical protein
LRPGTLKRIGRQYSTAGINAFEAVSLQVLVGALSEDYACLCLPGQHVETPCRDLMIVLVEEIEWFLCSLPVFVTSWVLGFRP